ncbi:MAG TPA: YihY/virulence factor BrkB family protein [Candidatus Angelobacter sp.]|jgi:membrane protein|nr:YihY/virulence factor BrkB family protein [Candidatus Angelobacter sp.]
MHIVRRLRSAFWGAFQHGQFSIAKAGAYSSILTLFPALLLVTSILEASHETEQFVREIAAAVGWALPPGPNSIAMSFFHANRPQTNRILFSAFTVTLLAATGVMISWMEGFRKAYGMANTWGFWTERLRALYLVLLALLPMTFATVLVVFGNQVETLVKHDAILRPLVRFLWTLGRWAIAIATSITFIALIYHHGMPRTQSWRRVLPGSVMATTLWFPATMIFGWYVTNYATYTMVYGSLGAAIALLVWLYILSVIVLLGAEFNAQLYPKNN